jgi:uncharacterized membrane protein YeiH
MSDISFILNFYPMVVQLLDYFGTMAFAVTGAFKAIEYKSDMVGVIILSIITGVAGGVIRDVVLGRFPPAALVNPFYLLITVSTGISIFFLYPKLKEHWNLFMKFDAIGLGVFTIIGATTAYSLFGLNLLIMIFSGVVTAIGGGILRDVFVNEIPLVFIRELYATASFMGIIIFYFLLMYANPTAATIIGVGSVTSIRLFTMRYRWNLPKAKDP